MRLLIILLSYWIFLAPNSRLHAGATVQASQTAILPAALFFSLEKSAPEAEKPLLKIKKSKQKHKNRFLAKRFPKKSAQQDDGDFSVFEYILMGLATLSILAALVLLIWGFAAGVLLWLIKLSFWLFLGQLLLHLIVQLVISANSSGWSGLRGIVPFYILFATSPLYAILGIILGAIFGLLWFWLSLTIMLVLGTLFFLNAVLSN